MSSAQRASTTAVENPTRGRWWLVAAALLLQFSIGSYVGGRIQDRRGPRIVALVGGVI